MNKLIMEWIKHVQQEANSAYIARVMMSRAHRLKHSLEVAVPESPRGQQPPPPQPGNRS
jgi:hypothetical protein